AGVDIDGVRRVGRQQAGVAPDGVGAALDGLARDVAVHRVVVVGDFERAEAELADVEGFERVFAAALPAAECLGEGHVGVPPVAPPARTRAAEAGCGYPCRAPRLSRGRGIAMVWAVMMLREYVLRRSGGVAVRVSVGARSCQS